MMKIKIVLIGTDGRREQTVEVAESGATVNEICKAANIDPKNRDFEIDGKPATLESHVSKGTSLGVSERPQGS